MDLVGFGCRVPHFSAQSALEYSLPVAVPATDAQYSRGRTRCDPSRRRILPAAGLAHSSVDRSDLDHGVDRVAGSSAIENVPSPRNQFSGLLRNLFWTAWEGLLSFADLPFAAGRRCRRIRSSSFAALGAMAQACDRRCFGCWRRSYCSYGGARVVAGRISELHALSPN